MIVLEAIAEFNNTQNSENFLNVTKLAPEWQMLEILFQHLYLVTVCDSCAFVLFYGNFIECSESSTVIYVYLVIFCLKKKNLECV